MSPTRIYNDKYSISQTFNRDPKSFEVAKETTLPEEILNQNLLNMLVFNDSFIPYVFHTCWFRLRIGLKASFYRLIKAEPLCFDGWKRVHGLLLLNIHESVIISKAIYSVTLTSADSLNQLFNLTKWRLIQKLRK